MKRKETISIAYHGNIVDLLQYAVDHEIKIELLSDQTSCHVPYDGGYCPQGLTFEERTEMLAHDKERFAELVNASLIKHFHLIKELVKRGAYFFDYGNSFMKQSLMPGQRISPKTELTPAKASFSRPMWRILWGLSSSTTATAPSAGAVCQESTRIW